METFLSEESELLFHEKKWIGEFHFLAGIDEAGRGCCAGPVCAASVMFTDFRKIPGDVMDSKQLTHENRMKIREYLLHEPSVIYGIAMVHEKEIDQINILRATWKAMRLAVQNMRQQPAFLLVDGNPVKDLPYPASFIVKGDAKSASIAAASILAKTSRDLLMLEYAKQYPQYGFEIHKGYCTELHTKRIQEYGVCEIHRKTFEPVKSILTPPKMIQDELPFFSNS